MTIEEVVEYEKCSITNARAIEILSRVTLAYEVGKVTVTQVEIQKALDMAIQALEAQTRDCKTCKRSANGECAFTEECHECMWDSKYEQQPCEDCISREAVLRLVEQYPPIIGNRCVGLMADIKHLPPVTPTISEKETVEDCISRQRVLNDLENVTKGSEHPRQAFVFVDECVDYITSVPSVTPSYNSVNTELDCVSREAVQDLIAKLLSDYLHDEDREKIENVNAEIGELPSVTPRAGWIPCSEKMPDVNIHVLAQFVMGGMAECYFAHNWWHIVGGFRISGDEVIAWMPLPPCYEPQEGEDEE